MRSGTAPDSPVLARVGPLSVGRAVSPAAYSVPDTGWSSLTAFAGVNQFRVRLHDDGGYSLRPDPPPNAATRQQMTNRLAVLVTRLNSAGDGLFSQSQDTFVVWATGWASGQWSAAADASRATRLTAALGSTGDRSQWYLVAVDYTIGGVDISENLQTFTGTYVPPAPPVPPPPSQVTGVRVSPLDGGLRVSWSAAAGPVDVSQYRVDVADASGERVRRVYTEADVLEAVVDGLANGVEYTVTVSALPGHGGENGPPSEPRTATPRADGEPEDVPVPALPLAGAGVLAALLTSAAYRFRSAGRRA